MAPRDDPAPSSLGFKYGDTKGDGGDVWLENKRQHDGAEGYWRIHDNLYDLTDFVDRHPGGKMWLELTKGTDITEAFEAHHITSRAENMLPKFHIRQATTPRHAPYTFKEDGFYRTLKRNVREIYETLPKNLGKRSDNLADGIVLTAFVLAILACKYWSYTLGVLSGSFVCFSVIIGHNYFHRADNFRMYYFEFSLMGVRDWRISHSLSHHLLTNSIYDMEISFFYPMLKYMPIKKGSIAKYMQWIVAPVLWLFLFYVAFLKRIVVPILAGKYIFRWSDLVPLFLPFSMYVMGGQSLLATLGMWTVITLWSSFHFSFVGFNAAHHHPDIFHDGDAVRKDMDWGICQLDAVMDRKEIIGSHFLVLTNFGDHGLHHMFPTLDHAYLDRLYPVFWETCKQFNIDLRITSQLDLIKGQFRQLLKMEPTRKVTDLLKYSKNK